MAASARSLDDHPLLTARHVDALTEAVRALTQVVSQANALIQKQLQLALQRDKPQEAPTAPQKPPPAVGRGAEGTAGKPSLTRRRAPRP